MQTMTDRLEAMLAQGKDNALLRYTLGKAYVEQDRPREGCAHLRAAVALDPAYSVAWKWLGKALIALDEPQQARQAWEQGMAAAQSRGDQQVVKELRVFLRRLDRATGSGTPAGGV